MGQNDDQIGEGAEDPSRTLDAGKPLHELGSRIGRYKLLSVLGEGGFGMVYLAEQDHPIRRLVALKVIKPGMDTKQVIARFETERQALALLDHPNIAQVYDAGATGAGRPYFAMEYVKGIPITEYCDKYKLGTQERLKLFIPLCQAIQHAHHKGIIHRDIKPSNALVMLHDEKPIPKIIDFGVAKALNQRLTERTLFTEQGQLIGTPEYMSPEQAELTGLDVDTRTDVYSLGVLLYELLTGSTPFDPEQLRSKGYAEMQRIICEQEPVKPSTKLTTLGGEVEDVAKQRSATADQLRKAVRGDLDWIVMKALEKDRARRYSTAQALAEDIERHLNHQPVTAGSPGVLYRARKFVRRHRTQAMVGGFLLAVAILAVALLGQYHRGQDQLKAVQQEFEAKQEALALENARNSLSTAQVDYASGRYAEAAKALKALVNNKYVGSQARLLRARMALDQPAATDAMDEQQASLGQSQEIASQTRLALEPLDVNDLVAELQALTNEPNDVASQAHLLLAKIYLESRADDDKTARELERQATEHLQKAEGLASDSADVFFGRALLSDTPAERMELLNKALKLNPGHVDSLRVRALAHYTSRDYDEMDNNASALKAVAKDNPEGWALRAIALREKAQLRGQKELLSRAVVEHTGAIERAPTQPRFYDQRRETYMRLGDYENALADARVCLRLSPEEGLWHHFYAFCALTALGRYAEAQREYETMLVASGGSGSFHWLAATYALDIVDRRSPWHPAGQEPQGTAFTILRQTIEAHQKLAKKAQCVVREATVPTWSPNGEEFAYGRGPWGYCAIEVFNRKTGTTRLLCYTGFDPAWSPDGRWIAFCRHRRTVRLQDLAQGKRDYYAALVDREVWIMNADGTGKPRMLAKGNWPSWTQDSKRLYYYSPEDAGYLCSISIEGGNARPARVMRPPNGFPLVSPDEKYVVWFNPQSRSGPAELVELSTGKVVARWLGWNPNWSPDSRRLIFSRFDGRRNGVWIYDVEKGKAVRVLEDWICWRCSWAPNVGQIALSLIENPRQVGEPIRPGMWGGIWVGQLDDGIFAAGSSASIQDWPQDESDVPSLVRMIELYQNWPDRTAVAEQLRRRLIEVLQQAVASSDPNSIQPVERLADVYLWLGQYEEAERLYRQACETRRVKYGAKAVSLLDLTEELVRFYLDVLDRYDEAERLCRELSKVRQEVHGADHPRVIRTRILLARIYERQRRYQEAERIYLDILNLKPSQDAKESMPEAYESVFWRYWPFAPLSYFLDETALILRLLEDRSDGIPSDKRWVICAHYLLARLYTTCPGPELHNVPKAIEHGTSACALSGGAEPICLDALAAAYAEAGQFDLAVRRQEEAIARLSGNKARMTTVFLDRLTMYKRGVSKRPRGLVARWEFEQNMDSRVADSSGNNLHGRLIGDAGVYADPERGNVLRLDGAGDWVDCGADARFDLREEITISAWIKVAKFDQPRHVVIAKGNGTTWQLQRYEMTDSLRFTHAGVQATPVIHYPGYPTGSANVNDGKWHHVAGVYDGRRISLYIDGEQDAISSAFAFSRIRITRDPVLIGVRPGRPRGWNGLLDDVRIYSYALLPEDIKALHEGKEPLSEKAPTR